MSDGKSHHRMCHYCKARMLYIYLKTSEGKHKKVDQCQKCGRMHIVNE